MIDYNFEVFKLPDDREVTSSSIYKGNKFDYDENGLYSQKIFGPLINYRCKCGNLIGKSSAGTCPKCGVICGPNILRRQRFGKIKLPEGVKIFNPLIITTLEDKLGASAMQKLLNPNYCNYFNDNPFYFNIEKKSLNPNKTDESDIKISGIHELQNIIQYIDFEKNIKDFVLLNEVPVIPPDLRPILVIDGITKMDKMSKHYLDLLLLNKDDFFTDIFNSIDERKSVLLLKYQNVVNKIFEEHIENYFRKKESVLKYSILGKVIEFSGRAVVIPAPEIKPYEVALSEVIIDKLFSLEKAKFVIDERPYKYPNDLIKNMKYNGGVDFDLTRDEKEKFFAKCMQDGRVIVERNPNLWKYSQIGVNIGKIYADD